MTRNRSGSSSLKSSIYQDESETHLYHSRGGFSRFLPTYQLFPPTPAEVRHGNHLLRRTHKARDNNARAIQSRTPHCREYILMLLQPAHYLRRPLADIDDAGKRLCQY